MFQQVDDKGRWLPYRTQDAEISSLGDAETPTSVARNKVGTTIPPDS